MSQKMWNELTQQLLPQHLAIILLVLILTSWHLVSKFTTENQLNNNDLRNTHRRIGISRSCSNLQDQTSARHYPEDDKPIRLQSLFIYPIKSCRGIEISQSKVLPTGLQFDRLFAFAQLKDDQQSNQKTTTGTEAGDGADDTPWQFLTMRQLPLMANVKVDLWLPKEDCKASGVVVVRFPWAAAGIRGVSQRLYTKLTRGLHSVPEKKFMLPLDFPSKTDILKSGYRLSSVKIWNEVTVALNLESAVPPELGEYLGCRHRLSLFRMDPSRQREVFRCAPRKEEAGHQVVVDFHDSFPLHLLSLSSLQEFETKVEKDQNLQYLDARRFRANLIVSGAQEYDEDTWRLVQLHNAQANASFDVSCRTARCKMPNVDPDTGIRHRAEPDRALRKYREVDEGAPKNGCLGMQLCPLFPEAASGNLEAFIEVGMEVTVLKRGTHLYVPQ